jgi:hypothetical protein
MKIATQQKADRSAGERFASPNLFIIGAAKAGTSALHQYLDEHADVFMCRPKEPGYFAHDPTAKRPFECPKTFSFDLAEYLKLFENARNARIRGDASTHYSKLPRNAGCAERIHEFNPNAFIIYMIRDPIERTISHYWWNVRWEGEKRDLFSAIRDDPQYRDCSSYARQIRPYLRLFGSARVLVLTNEELKAKPRDTVREVYKWLEIDWQFQPASIGRKINDTPDVVIQPRSTWLERFRMSGFWNSIGPRVPTTLRASARRMLHREIDRQSVSVTAVEEYLRPAQLNETADLSELLGRRFDDWKTLYDGDA